MPIYQTSSFGFDNMAEAEETFSGVNKDNFVYTRGRNPNTISLAKKIAMLSQTTIQYIAPDGIVNLTPATEETLAVELKESFVNGSSYGMFKNSAYAFVASAAGAKADTAGAKMGVYGMKADKAIIKAPKNEVKVEVQMTVSIQTAAIILIA